MSMSRVITYDAATTPAVVAALVSVVIVIVAAVVVRRRWVVSGDLVEQVVRNLPTLVSSVVIVAVSIPTVLLLADVATSVIDEGRAIQAVADVYGDLHELGCPDGGGRCMSTPDALSIRVHYLGDGTVEVDEMH